jgi:hypothetical protein
MAMRVLVYVAALHDILEFSRAARENSSESICQHLTFIAQLKLGHADSVIFHFPFFLVPTLICSLDITGTLGSRIQDSPAPAES